MFFLGTGAAELSPNPFCNCEVCARLRKEGAKPRKRSSLLIDSRNIVDFGPEVPAASQQYGQPLYDLDNVFITHTHEDHFAASTAEILTMTPYRNGRILAIYMSEKGIAWTFSMIEAMDSVSRGKSSFRKLLDTGKIRFVPVKPYVDFTAGGMEVFAVESNHHANGDGELALNYLFRLANGKKLMYSADTGLYNKKNLEALSGSKADCLVMEGTGGSKPFPDESAHLNAENYVRNVRAMAENEVISNNTAIFVTHICSVGNNYNHEEYQAYLDANCRYKATVAYDGMEYSL